MGDTLRLTVPESLSGERLDKVLADLLGVSRSVARSLVDEGVHLGGRPAKGNTRMSAGDVIVTPPPRGRGDLTPEPIEFAVLYEDDSVVVVDKPAGVVVHPGSGRQTGTLASGLLARYPELRGVGAEGRWGLVHRLDKDTSGAILVARRQVSFEELGAQLRRREVRRSYVALVEGVLRPPTGTIDAPIGRDPQVPTRRAVVRDGRPARTHYRVVETFAADDASLLEVSLETGRTHQIRVHFAAIGHPVVGDPAYGSGRSGIVTPRIFLHAARIGFTHPTTGEGIEVESPLPDDLSKVLRNLRSADSG